jgi:hypothetical protein
VQQPRRGLGNDFPAFVDNRVDRVITIVVPPLRDGDDEASIGISDDFHLVTPLGYPVVQINPT